MAAAAAESHSCVQTAPLGQQGVEGQSQGFGRHRTEFLARSQTGHWSDPMR